MATTRFHGVGVNWGIATSAISNASGNGASTGTQTFGTTVSLTGLFQTRDQGFVSEAEAIKNGVGDTSEKTWYDVHQTSTFEYVASGAGPSGTVPVPIPSIGDLITITDSQYTQIAGTNWLIDEVDTKSSNTTAVRVTLKLSSYPNLTS